MNTSAILFMSLTWGAVIALNIFCHWKMLTVKKKKKLREIEIKFGKDSK